MNPDIAAIFEKKVNAKINTAVALDSEVVDALDEVSKAYSQSRSDVVNHLLRHILLEQKEKKTPVKRGPRGSKEQRHNRNAMIYGMHAQGMTNAQIAEKVNLSAEHIRQIVNKKKDENDALVILEKAIDPTLEQLLAEEEAFAQGG